MMPRPLGDPREMLESRLIPEPNSGCLLWMGHSMSKGYGQIKIGGRKGKMYLTHRLAWELENGEIPDDLCVMHKCDVPACCNPAHLQLGTLAENNADMKRKGRNNTTRTVWGETHGLAKITEADVVYIRSCSERGIDLAAKFGLGKSTIGAIRKRQLWKHVA